MLVTLSISTVTPTDAHYVRRGTPMSQPPRADDPPTAGLPGYPEPAPVPEPGPPQPIPPPDPVPIPEPPHAAPPARDATGPPEPEPDVERTWHAPIPAELNFHPAHEAHWPPQPGEHQWQPSYQHDKQWHPRHGDPGVHSPAVPGPPDAASGQDGTAAPRRPRRMALWLSIVLAFTLLLCGGGAVSAFLLLRNSEDGGGAPDPATAVTRFLSAVYSEQDAAAANGLVCSEARDRKQLAAKIEEVKGYADRYDGPQVRWDEPAVSNPGKERATVTVQLSMTTNDEKSAQQRLTFTVVKKTGWWVCEVAG